MVYFVCIYVCDYYLSVLSMSDMGFQKNNVWLGWWVGGCAELYPVLFVIFVIV